MLKPRGVVPAGSAPAVPADGRGGIRHEGCLSRPEAVGRNGGTWSIDANGAAQVEAP